MRLRLAALRRRSPTLAASTERLGVVSGDFVEITRDAFAGLENKQQPTAYELWPQWAKGVKLFCSEGERGVGDTVKAIIGDYASEQFSHWHKFMFGTACKCRRRQAEWNARFPY